jgi:hypothetical protein
MVGYDGSIRIDTKMDTKGFNKGMNGMTNAMKGFASIFVKVKIAQMIFEIGKSAVNMASQLQEVQNVVDTAFGSMAHKVEEFADTAIEKFGMSELTAKRTASTYMAMSKGMGIVGEAAADMALDVTGLTGDMASFFNVSQDVADTALKSIWTGETEALKKFGVVMTQANLQQFAYAKGINKNISAMSQSELVMLRYKFVTEKLALAQGDFAKTSGSWANQTRILSERWKEFLGLIGNVLIPMLLPVVQFLNKTLELLINILKKIGEIYTTLTGKTLEVAKSTTLAADAEFEFADGIDAATKAAKNALAPFDELNVLQNDMGSTDYSLGGGFDFSTSFPEDIKESENNVKGLKKELDDFFVITEDRFNRLNSTLMMPVYIPSPVFAELPNPVYKPNWGLNLPPMPVPEFKPIKSPVYQPEWGLNNSFALESNLVEKSMESFSKNLVNNMEITFKNLHLVYEMNRVGLNRIAENIGKNSEQLGKTISENFNDWKEKASQNVGQFASNVTGAIYLMALNGIMNTNSFLSTTYDNISGWINSTSQNFAAWGNGVISIVGQTAQGIVSTLASGLKAAWSNFVDFMKSTGEKVSSWYNANESWLIPTLAIGVVGGVVLATGGAGALALKAGALLAPLTTLKALPIPALATGAVIPPNSEFLAILGDQKSGRNIEAPEGLIRKIIKEELEGLSGSQNVTINFAGNMGQLIRVLKPYIDTENRRVGNNLIEGAI